MGKLHIATAWQQQNKFIAQEAGLPVKMEFSELFTCLLPKAASWKSIGAVLGLSTEELSTIGAGSSDPEECLRRLLQEWYDRTPNSSWDQVITALGAPLLGEMELAMELEQKAMVSVSSPGTDPHNGLLSPSNNLRLLVLPRKLAPSRKGGRGQPPKLGHNK